MIYLSLGSNLSSSFGNRFDNLDLAIKYLEHYDCKIKKKSSFYETPSYPNTKNPKFINIVIEIKTNLDEVNLASVLIYIEKKLERKRNMKNEPRTCDIDIIDYKNKVIEFYYNNLKFIVPHENLIYRNFVLYPLREIFPEWKHPKTNDSVTNLIDMLKSEDKKSILKVEKS